MERETGKTGANHLRNVPCPFCGLVCDDLEIGPSGDGLKVLKNGCPKSVAGFERPLVEPSPQIDGRDVSLTEAVARAAELIRESRLPLFGGLGTDVAGIRSTLALAEKAGGAVDHAMSDYTNRNYRVAQTSGWVMTTLTEARNRADLFLIAGCDVEKVNPRFFERIVTTETSMFADKPAKRTVIFLGEGLDTSPAKGARIGDVLTLPAKIERIEEVFDALRALNKGATLTAQTIGGLPRAAIDDLFARCKAASYGVVVWSASSFKFANADLTVQAICEFVKEINATSRFAGLSMGGSEGSTSAGYVATWQTGFPLRVSYANGKPDYDAERYAGSRLLANKDCDLLVWSASYTPDLSPPDTDVPLILLGTPSIVPKRTPKVYIPVGTPGVDHAGAVVRVDGSVTLPLRKLRQTKLPSTAAVLAHIEAAL